MRKFGYADLVGIVAALAALTWVPGLNDPLTYTKLWVLATGGFALIPAAIWRWKSQGRNAWYVWMIPAASILLVLWGFVSLLASSAPIANSLFGWWGRADGLLALGGAVGIFLGAATLRSREWARAVSWLLVGATIASFVGLLQAAGVEILGTTQVMSLMGNTNFAAGYFAMMFPLALGRALMSAALWQRVWAGSLAAVIALLAWLTEALQGPVAVAASALAFGVIYAIGYRGRLRALGLAAAAVIVVSGATLLALSFAGIGPLTRLWSEQTFVIRQQYWQSGWNILTALPVFGTGPDGFARYVSEYRPESYVEVLGPVIRVSAAHNIPLQIGATLGAAAMVLWLVVMLGTLVVLLARAARGRLWQLAATASVGGALTAYLVQGLVSIDMLPVLATGWAVAGLALAAGREALSPATVEAGTQAQTPSLPKSRKEGSPAQQRKARAAAFRPDDTSTPAWVPISAGALGLVMAVAVGAQLAAVNSLTSLQTQEDALAALTSSMTPCPPRAELAQGIIQQVDSALAVPALVEATAIDPRCPGMLALKAEVLIQLDDLTGADEATALLTQLDPLYADAWVLRGLYQVAAGDAAGAQVSLMEAERVNALYPDPSAGEPRLQALRDAIVKAAS